MSDTILIVNRDTGEIRKLRVLLIHKDFSVMTATDIKLRSKIVDRFR